MASRLPLPENLGMRPFAVRDALDAGVLPTRLRSRDLDRPFWGVRAPVGTTGDLVGLAVAYSSRMPRHAVFSHLTAARLWQIPLPLSLERDRRLHVAVPHPGRAPAGRGVVGHRLQLADAEIAPLYGLRVTTLERTLFDLAALVSDEQFVAAGDNILWWRRPPRQRATTASLSAEFERFTGRRGRTRATLLLPFLSDRADSPPESAFRLRFARAGLPAPQVNKEIYDARGRFIAMPDLQFEEFRMALDYEGDGHRTDKAQWRKDLARVPRLQDENWHHTRMSGADLADSTELMHRLERLLRERGWNGRTHR